MLSDSGQTLGQKLRRKSAWRRYSLTPWCDTGVVTHSENASPRLIRGRQARPLGPNIQMLMSTNMAA